MDWTTLLAFVTGTTLLALSPGPDNLFVLAHSAAHGARSGLAVVLGLASGCVVHTAFLALGLTVLLSGSELALGSLKVFGSAYLLLLAYRVWRSGPVSPVVPADESTSDTTSPGPFRMWRRGVAMNLLNPKVSLFFLAFFPGFRIHPDWPLGLQFTVLGGFFIAVTLVVFGGIALLAGRLGRSLSTWEGAGRFFMGLQLVTFIGIAIFIWIPHNNGV